MSILNDSSDFENNMQLIKKLLDDKGVVMESDHPYAYSMQYAEAFDEVAEWLYQNGYQGDLDTMGAFDGVAVYGLYDTKKVSYDEMRTALEKEASKQKKDQ